jgi:hypothetical protein
MTTQHAPAVWESQEESEDMDRGQVPYSRLGDHREDPMHSSHSDCGGLLLCGMVLPCCNVRTWGGSAMSNSAAGGRSPLGLFPGQPAPRLYDSVVEALRSRHYSRRTERGLPPRVSDTATICTNP